MPLIALLADIIIISIRKSTHPLLSGYWYGHSSLTEKNTGVFVINTTSALLSIWLIGGVSHHVHLILLPFAAINSLQQVINSDNQTLALAMGCLSSLAPFYLLYF